MIKQARFDIANAAEAVRLVLLDNEKERAPFLTQSDKAALMDARAVLMGKLIRELGEPQRRTG